MANIETLIDEDGNKVLNVNPEGDTQIKLATADTYVDKNIIINLPSEQVQADWSINDPEDPAYVKNRTHWYEEVEDTSIVYTETNLDHFRGEER